MSRRYQNFYSNSSRLEPPMYNRAKAYAGQIPNTGLAQIGGGGLGAYGSFEIRRKQLGLELEGLLLDVRFAKLELERHDDNIRNENEWRKERESNGHKLDDAPIPSWQATTRRGLELAIDEAQLAVRRHELAIERHEADQVLCQQKEEIGARTAGEMFAQGEIMAQNAIKAAQ